MHVSVTGSTGKVGQALLIRLRTGGAMPRVRSEPITKLIDEVFDYQEGATDVRDVWCAG